MDNAVSATFRNPLGDSAFGFLVGNACGPAATVTVYRLVNGTEALVKTVQVAANGFSRVLVPWQSLSDAGRYEGVSGVSPIAYRLASDHPVVAYQFNTLDNAFNLGTACTTDAQCQAADPNDLCALVTGVSGRQCVEPSYSQDSSALVPTQALGTSYLVASVESVSTAGVDGGAPFSGVADGQASIIATEDLTTVTVLSRATITDGGPVPKMVRGQTQLFLLNRYDVLQVSTGHVFTAPLECAPNPFGGGNLFCREDNDLSGSVVTSDKPIAVFGGSPCAMHPISAFACDHLEEQLPSSSTLGKAFVLARTAPVRLTDNTLATAANAAPDFFKVIAACPASTCPTGTLLTFAIPPAAAEVLSGGGCAGSAVATNTCRLAGGAAVEFSSRVSRQLATDQPVVVAQFLAGQGATTGTTAPNEGDPSMILVPPVEQWPAEVAVVVPDFNDNYLSVAIDSANTSNLQLDGTKVLSAAFTAVDGGTYRTANLTVTPGLHHLTATAVSGQVAKMGVITYGFSPYVSYGSVAGQRYEPISTVVP